jgi:hypothetical protein
MRPRHVVAISIALVLAARVMAHPAGAAMYEPGPSRTCGFPSGAWMYVPEIVGKPAAK